MKLTGNDSPLPFLILFSLRSHIGRNRALTGLTALALATSVALSTSLEVSTRSVRMELSRTAEALAGDAKLAITGGSLGVPETLLEQVKQVAGVAAASPLIQITLRLDEGAREGQALRVLGIDFLSDRNVRRYSVAEANVQVMDPLRLLAEREAIIITRALAERLDLKMGDRLAASSSLGRFSFVVRGFLEPGGVADAYDGQIAAIDIYSLQDLLGRRGWFDRMDVVPNAEVGPSELHADLARAVAGVAAVRRSASGREIADRAFGLVSLACWLLVAVGVVVATFLTYAVISAAVDRRAPEFALLQSLGLEARRVRRLVRTDTALLGALGTLAGLFAGLALARVFFPLLAKLSYHLQKVDAAEMHLSWLTVVLAVTIGLVVTLAAAAEPAHRATARLPLEVLHGARRSALFGMNRRRGVLLLLCFALATVSWNLLGQLPPLLVLIAVFGSTLVAVIVTFVPTIRSLIRYCEPALSLVVPRLSDFIGTSLDARPIQTGLTAAAIVAIVGGLASIFVVLSSVGSSIELWIKTRYPDGIIISAGDPFESPTGDYPLVPESVVTAIKETPGAGDALEGYTPLIQFGGREVTMIVRSYAVFRKHGRLSTLGADPDDVAAALIAGEAAVSEGFARAFGYSVGDTLPLNTPGGTRDFRIAALVRDYVGPGGTVHLDVRTFDRFWPRRGASAVVIWPSEESGLVVDRIRERVGRDHTLFFTEAAAYAKYADRLVGRFVGLLYGIGLLSALLGSVAVLNLMLGSIAEQRRELALLRAAGATGSDLSVFVLADLFVLALVASSAGLMLGIASSVPMIAVLERTMGWTINHSLDWRPLLGVLLVALGSALFAGLLPLWSVRRVSPIEMFLPE